MRKEMSFQDDAKGVPKMFYGRILEVSQNKHIRGFLWKESKFTPLGVCLGFGGF